MGQPEFTVDFPTLGDLIDAWVEHHCRVPDGFARKKPFKMADWQFWCTANHYRVRPDAKWIPARPLLNQAFVYRRSQIVAPQKTGKGPWSATITCVEAVGPSIFGGWARPGEFYDCAEFGCGCGWTFEYQPGEPKGIRHPSPLIQLTATSEDQVDTNIYTPLRAMIAMGPLSDLMKPREGFIRIVGDADDVDLDRIDVVTASANSRLGNPVTFAIQDESGLYTDTNKLRKVAEAQRRGAAGMGGRTMETTNCWDPSENSVAQTTHLSAAMDVFRFYRKPPADLSYRNKKERRQIHRYVYEGSWWVDLDSIEAEAAELLETDPAQAERFFGNRLVHGKGSWMPDGLWERTAADRPMPPDGTEVCAGFDGSSTNDHTGIRLRTLDGYRFTPTYLVGNEERPTHWDPKQWPGGEVPRNEVRSAWDQLCTRYKIIRAYCDPPEWDSELIDLQLTYSEDVFVFWYTRRVQQMHDALKRSLVDLASGRSTHDACSVTAAHVANARKVASGKHYILGKPNDHQKIDMAMADTLAWEAGEDARAAGWNRRPKNAGTGKVLVMD